MNFITVACLVLSCVAFSQAGFWSKGSHSSSGEREGSWHGDPETFTGGHKQSHGRPRGFWTRNRLTNWWTGDNVCMKRNEINETMPYTSRHRYSTRSFCQDTEQTRKCTTSISLFGIKRTFTATYQCCLGFARVPGQMGCPKKLQLKDILATSQDLEAKQVVDAITQLGLNSTLGSGNFTLFAPTDNAFEKYVEGRQPEVNTGVVQVGVNPSRGDNTPPPPKLVIDLQDILKGHVVPGFVMSGDLRDEQLVQTLLDQAKLRINFYNRPKRLATVNCAPIVSKDNPATNGFVHTVNKVLQPVTQSLMDMVASNPDLTTLKTLIGQAGLTDVLRKAGQLTLFAPTNAAFEKLDPGLKTRLMNGDSCLEKILKNHVLKNVICSSIIVEKIRSINLLDSFIKLSRDRDNKLFVGGAQIVANDMMATNGVLHIIDGTLVPNDALDVMEIAKKNGYTEIIKLIQTAGLEQTVRNLKNFTFFVPNNQAIKNLPPGALAALSSDQTALRDLLLYHVTQPSLSCSEMSTGDNFTSLNSARSKFRIDSYSNRRAFHYGSFKKTVQCAPIVRRDVESCEGRVNVITKVMIPPTGDIVNTLQEDGNFSTLVSAIVKGKLADTLKGNGPFTVFAPTNKAFEKLRAEVNDEKTIADLLRRHIVRGNLCCAGIFRTGWMFGGGQRVRTLQGDRLTLNRNRQGDVTVDSSQVTECDRTATNGVIHVINTVLEDVPRRNMNRIRDLWPMRWN